MFLSILFLLATFLIYACIRELRKLHGKAVMCYVFSLILVYLNIASARMYNSEIFKLKLLCEIVGYMAYASTLSCFLWLNVMSFDIWSTFRFDNEYFAKPWV